MAPNITFAISEVDMPIHVYTPDYRKSECFRSRFRESLSPYYVGWSDEVDKRHDDRTVCFGLSAHPKKKPDAMCRVICKKFGPAVSPLPMETADKGACVSGDGRRSVEGSAFCFSNWNDGIDLIYGVIGWAIINDVDQCYVLYDPLNRPIRDFYLEALRFTSLANEVIFSSFLRRSTLEPVKWRVATADRRTLKEARRRLARAGAMPRPIRAESKLGGWAPVAVPSY